VQEARRSVEQQTLSREFALTGSLDALEPGRDIIMDFVHEYCADEQQEIDIQLALQEALANAILHGCKNDPAKLVHCSVVISPSDIEFIVRDPGEGFDTASAADESEDGSNLTQHGRGILLMRSLMDEVTYRRNGSELHLRKVRSHG
jgi:serine/threonine-protein kinase RsbW